MGKEERSGGGEPERRRRGERSEEHTSELQSQSNLVCRLLLEKKKQRELAHQDPIDRLSDSGARGQRNAAGRVALHLPCAVRLAVAQQIELVPAQRVDEPVRA